MDRFNTNSCWRVALARRGEERLGMNEGNTSGRHEDVEEATGARSLHVSADAMSYLVADKYQLTFKHCTRDVDFGEYLIFVVNA